MRIEVAHRLPQLASGTFMVLDRGGVPRAEFSKENQMKFLSAIPDLEKSDDTSQIVISGLLEAIKITVRESLGGSNYMSFPAGPRTLVLYPIELNVVNRQLEPFTVVLDCPPNMISSFTALNERRRVESILSKLKLYYRKGQYSFRKTRYYYAAVDSIMNRASFNSYTNELTSIIPTIEPMLKGANIDLAVLMLFDNANHYCGGCNVIDENAISPETRLNRLVKQAVGHLTGLGNQNYSVGVDPYGFASIAIHGNLDRARNFYFQISEMIEENYYTKENKYYPPVKEQNKVLSLLPMMDSSFSLTAGFASQEPLTIEIVKSITDTLVRSFQALDLTFTDPNPLVPGSKEYDEFSNAFSNIITNRDEV